MKPIPGNILLRKYSLLILAALLFILSFIFNKLYINRSSVAQEVSVAERYLHRQQNDFDEFLKDTAGLNRFLAGNESLHEFSRLASKRYSIFLYSINEFGSARMKFWNDQRVIPSPGILTGADGDYFSHLSNGWYFTVKKTLAVESMGGFVMSYAMIPVRTDFFIETDYLPKEFVYSKTADKRVLISEKPTEFPVRSPSGKILFYFDNRCFLVLLEW